MSRADTAALLRDVAQAIISSGYAVLPKRPYVRRAEQIAELARDRMVDYPAYSLERYVLIDCVMRRYSASRWTARRMIAQAQKMREENNGAKTQ